MYCIKQLLASTALILTAASCVSSVSAVVSDAAACANKKVVGDNAYEQIILNDIALTLSEETLIGASEINVPRSLDDVNAAIRDCYPSSEGGGRAAWKFLQGMASSDTFVNEYWHKRPLLIRAANTGGWVEGYFTVDKDLR
jgi:hypothetical protein